MFERRPEQNLRYPLLLIHGLFSSSRTWRKTVADFAENYDIRYGGEISASAENAVTPGDLYTLNFSNNHNLSYREQALEIRAAVETVKKINAATQVILAGHSMGGLAARAAVQLIGASDVYALITLGTPHYGSPLALLRDETHAGARRVFSRLGRALARAEPSGEKRPGFFRRILMRLMSITTEAEGEIDRFFSSEAFAELMPGSPALEELNRAPLPPGLRYVFVVGSVTDFAAFRDSSAASQYRKLTAFWIRTVEHAVRGFDRRYLNESNRAFRAYVARYYDGAGSVSENQWMDFDGAVPVLSQVLHHFVTEPVQRAVLPVFASHTRLTKRPAKLFQALALCGAVGAR